MIILWINSASQGYVLSFQMDHAYTFYVTTEGGGEEIPENGIVDDGADGVDLVLLSIVDKGNSIRRWNWTFHLSQYHIFMEIHTFSITRN